MITPAFNLTATERVLPKLALDFTTASLDSRVTFTRTTSASNPATYVNISGVITAATNNQPRFDYDPVTLACKGLLIEESKTNFLLYSDQFNTVSWGKTNLTVTADSIISPDNTLSADKLVENTALTASHIIDQAASVTSGVTYTFSSFLKKAERGYALMAFVTGFPTTAIQINLTTGVVTTGTGTPLNAFSQNIGNGWFRVGFSLTATSTTSIASPRIYLSTDGLWANRNYTGDGTSGIYIWGAQFEAGAFPTSYIPTTTTALTRNADVATITGTNFSSFWQAGRGGVLVRALPSTVSGTRPLVQFDDNTADNIIALRGNTTNPELYIVDGGAPQVQLDAGTIVANTPYNLTGWWQTNDCKARQNSGATVSDYTATIPTVTQARLGSDGTNYLNGHLATINYYNKFTGQIYTRRKNKAVFSLL